MDEPFFLAIGRQILRSPVQPLDFTFNWYGQAVPMASINNTPPLLGYLLAAAYALTGGEERLMRLCFFPFDLAAALSLYLLAARFLKRPLLPTLIVIAGPAYCINLNHLMAERLMAAFAFPCLYALVRGVDEKDGRWFWGSAALGAAALLSKYNAIFVVLPAALYAWNAKAPPRRIALWAGAAGTPLAAYLLLEHLGRGAAVASAWAVTADASGQWWSSWPHKLRSFLAFTGGCSLVGFAWPMLAWRRRPAFWLALAAAVAFLFLPVFDLAPVVRSVDRWTGVFMAAAGAAALGGLFFGDRSKGWALWAPWVLSVGLIQVGLYWSVMSRFILFLLPPLVFGLAERLEDRLSWPSLKAVYAGSLACLLLLSLALSLVDYRYAQAQKEAALDVRAAYPGRKLWSVPHWGLQYYLEQAGAVEMDWAKGGWDNVRPGDVVVITRVNSNVYRPRKPIAVRQSLVRLGTPIPLRLISGWDGEAGFYSNTSGFLPYSLSAEPLEEFRVLEAL